MNRLVNLYRICFLVEVLVWSAGATAYIYYRPHDIDGFMLLLLGYLCMLVSFITGINAATLSGRMIKVKDTIIICGHIGNSIKLLYVLITLCFLTYYISYSRLNFNIFNGMSFLYYISLFAAFSWVILSIFSFIAFIIIANKNRKTRFTPIDDLGITLQDLKTRDKL